MADKKIKITMVRSAAHRSKDHLKVLHALGLRKTNQAVVRPDNPAVRGMVKQLDYMLKTEEA